MTVYRPVYRSVYRPVYRSVLAGGADGVVVADGSRQYVAANKACHTGNLSQALPSGWVSFFVYHDAFAAGTVDVALGNTANDRVIFYTSGTTLFFFIAAAGSTLVNASLGIATTGRWYHVLARWDASGYAVFVDAVSVASASGDYAVDAILSHCTVGRAAPYIASGWPSIRVSELFCGTTYVSGMETTLRAAGSGIVYESLASSDVTAWGMLNAYNCNESAASDNLIDAHGSNDLTLVTNGGTATAAPGEGPQPAA